MYDEDRCAGIFSLSIDLGRLYILSMDAHGNGNLTLFVMPSVSSSISLPLPRVNVHGHEAGKYRLTKRQCAKVALELHIGTRKKPDLSVNSRLGFW